MSFDCTCQSLWFKSIKASVEIHVQYPPLYMVGIDTAKSMTCQTLHYSIFLYFYRISLYYYCIFWDLYLISGNFYFICFVSILSSMICIQYIRLFLLYNVRLYCIFSHLHCIFLDLYLISGHFYSILLHYYCIFLDMYLISGHFYYI